MPGTGVQFPYRIPIICGSGGMEDVPDLEFGVSWRVGSSPTSRTNIWFHRSSVRMMVGHAIEAGSTPAGTANYSLNIER